MLKRLMIWLLNQIQKLKGVFTRGQASVRSQNSTEDLSSNDLSSVTHSARPQSSATRLDIGINTVAPVAKRVSLAPANSKREQPESVDSLFGTAVDSSDSEPTADDLGTISSDTDLGDTDFTVELAATDATEEIDTHRRLDATAAAVAGQESDAQAMSTSLSELIAADAPYHSAVDAALPAPAVDTQGNYQLPAIYDLLPAIEPDTEPDTEAIDLSDTSDLLPLEAAEQIAEQATLLSFDIYESEVAAVDEVEIISGVKQVIELKEDSETQELGGDGEEISEIYEELADDNIADKVRAIEKVGAVEESAIEESAAEALAIEESAVEESTFVVEYVSTLEPDSEDTVSSELAEPEPFNPWTTAIASKTHESAQTVLTEKTEALNTEISEPETPKLDTQAVEQNNKATATETSESETPKTKTKPGIVKLLFTIKPGNYHGYIAPADGSKDILFHQKYINADIFEKIERGTPVIATVKLMEGKAYATYVELNEALEVDEAL